MAYYIEFSPHENGIAVLMEVDKEDVQPSAGVEKVGILPRTGGGDTIVRAQTGFTTAIQRVVQETVHTLTGAIQNLEMPPTEIELTFALKATGEAGNLAIAKVGGEANFQLKLIWQPSDKPFPATGLKNGEGTTPV